MNTDLLTEYNLFIQTMQRFPQQWLNNYFDLLKRLLNDLSLDNDSPQLAISVTIDNNLHVNIGQRWVSKPFNDGTIGLILTLDQDLTPLNCERIGYFTIRKTNEAQWVCHPFSNSLSPDLYNAWLTASKTEVERVKTKSGYRKYHSSLFYDTVMRDEARKELMIAAFEKEEVI